MLSTAFTDLVGCQVPIQQAGMGGVSTPELAAAVADAGGLGMVSMVMHPAHDVAVALDALAGQTAGMVGINFLMPFLDPEAIDVAASRVRVVEFFYADPDAALVRRVHRGERVPVDAVALQRAQAPHHPVETPLAALVDPVGVVQVPGPSIDSPTRKPCSAKNAPHSSSRRVPFV